MRLAIPIWEKRVSPVFDTAERLLIVDVEENEISYRQGSLALCPSQQRMQLLNQLGVAILICGAITRPLWEGLVNSGIEVIPNICGDVDLILQSYLSGEDIKGLFVISRVKKKRSRDGRQ